MATNLNPATATFGTSNLVGETNDIFPATTWAQMAHNTGFNWYTVRHLITQTQEITRTPGNETEQNQVYMAAGTYAVYVSSYFDLENGATAQGTIRLQGEDIITQSGVYADWIYGSATIIVDTGGWVAAQYNAVGESGTKATVKNTTFYFHRGTEV